jgi:hypothetical protein
MCYYACSRFSCIVIYPTVDFRFSVSSYGKEERSRKYDHRTITVGNRARGAVRAGFLVGPVLGRGGLWEFSQHKSKYVLLYKFSTATVSSGHLKSNVFAALPC